MDKILLYAKWIAGTTEALLLLVSVWRSMRPFAPRYLKWLPLFAFLNILSDIIVWRWPASLPRTYLLFTVFELIFFSWLLHQLLQSKSSKTMLIVLNLLFLIYLAYYVIINHHIPPYGPPVVLESIIIIIPSIQYFRKMPWRKIDYMPFNDPGYWLVTGILLYFLLEVPILVYNNISYLTGSLDLGDVIDTVNAFCLTVMYLLFIIGLLCKTPKPSL